MAQGPVPRPAPELKIVEATGKPPLSSLRGHVVLLAFISTECPHCQRASGVFEQLSHEFAGRLQVAEVAFNEGADTAAFSQTVRVELSGGARQHRCGRTISWDSRAGAAGNSTGRGRSIASGVIRAQSERLGKSHAADPRVLARAAEGDAREDRDDRPLLGDFSVAALPVPSEAGILAVRMADADWFPDHSRIPDRWAVL